MQNDSDRGKQYVPLRQIRESVLTGLGCRPAGGAAHTGVARGPDRKRRGIAGATWLAVQKASVAKEMTCCRAYAWSREDVSLRQGTALPVRCKTVAPDLRVRRARVHAVKTSDSEVRRYRSGAFEGFCTGLLRARPFVPTVPEYVLRQWYESLLSGPIEEPRWGTVVV